jgi:hypothetical protein
MNIATATQQSLSLASNVSVTLDGVGISMVGSYPVATGTASGIFGAAGLSADYSTTGGGTGLSTTLTIQVANAPTPASCAFSYTSASATAPPAIAPVVTTGC